MPRFSGCAPTRPCEAGPAAAPPAPPLAPLTLEAWIARRFAMTDAVWQRHANPWSVWTRTTALPLLLLAIASRAWIGPWALAPVAAALVWIWLNPRLFPPPRSTDTWAARATFGERLWLARDRVPVPPRHRRPPAILSGIAGAGGLLALGGAIALALWPALLGTAVCLLAKLWFCDRMVWLYEDVAAERPEWRARVAGRPGRPEA